MNLYVNMVTQHEPGHLRHVWKPLAPEQAPADVYSEMGKTGYCPSFLSLNGREYKWDSVVPLTDDEERARQDAAFDHQHGLEERMDANEFLRRVYDADSEDEESMRIDSEMYVDHDRSCYYYMAVAGCTPAKFEAWNLDSLHATPALSKDGRYYVLVWLYKDGMGLHHIRGWDFAAAERYEVPEAKVY